MMSAFAARAARQQLWGVSSASSAVEKAPEPEQGAEDAKDAKDATQERRSETPSTRPIPSRSKRRSAEEPVSDSVDVDKGGSGYVWPGYLASLQRVANTKSPATPRSDSAGVVPVKQHSSFRPNKKNLQRKAGARLVFTTPEAEASSSPAITGCNNPSADDHSGL